MIISFIIIIKMLFLSISIFCNEICIKIHISILTLILNSSFWNFNYFKYLVDKETFETIALNITQRAKILKK